MGTEYEHWKEMAVRGNSATERYPTSGHLPIEGTSWTDDDAPESKLMATVVSSIIGLTLLLGLVGYLASWWI